MALAFPKHEVEVTRAPHPWPWQGVLARIRSAGLKARLHPASAAEDALDRLVSDLPAALGRRLTFHEPGATEVSFDEAWLCNALDAVRQGDTDRYAFALRSRLTAERAARLHVWFCRAAQNLE